MAQDKHSDQLLNIIVGAEPVNTAKVPPLPEILGGPKAADLGVTGAPPIPTILFEPDAPQQPTTASLGQEEPSGSFVTGLKTGVQSIYSNVGSSFEILGHLSGSPSMMDTGRKMREDAEREIQRYAPKITRLEDIEGETVLETLGNAADYMVFTFAQAAPSLGASIGGGVAGALAATPIPVPGARVAGGIAGSAFVSLVLNAGEIYADQIARGATHDEAVAAAGGGGAISAILDSFVPIKVANRLVFRPVSKIAGQSLRRRFVGEALKGGAQEAITEAGQEAVKIGAREVTLDESPFTAEALSDTLNAAAAGFIGGAPIAGAAGLVPGREGGEVTPLPPSGDLSVPPPTAPLRPEIGEGLPLVEETPPFAAEVVLEGFPELPGVEPEDIAPPIAGDFGAVSPPVEPDPQPDPLPEPPSPPVATIQTPPIVGTGSGGSVQIGDIQADAGPLIPGKVITAQLTEPQLVELTRERFEDMIDFTRIAEKLPTLQIKKAREALEAVIAAPTYSARRDAAAVLGELVNRQGIATDRQSEGVIRGEALLNTLTRLIPQAQLRETTVERLVDEALSQARLARMAATDLIQSGVMPDPRPGGRLANLSNIANELVRRGESLTPLLEGLSKAIGEPVAEVANLLDYLSPGITESAIEGAVTPLPPGYLEAVEKYIIVRKGLERNSRPSTPAKKILRETYVTFDRQPRTVAEDVIAPTGTRSTEYYFQHAKEHGEFTHVESTSDPAAEGLPLSDVVDKHFGHGKPDGHVYIVGEFGPGPEFRVAVLEQMKAWLDTYTPGIDIYLFAAEGNQAFGFGSTESLGATITPRPGVALVYMNAQSALSLESAMSILAHEFGHVIVADRYYNGSRGTRNAIRAEYYKWVKQVSDMPVGDFLDSYATPFEGRLGDIAEASPHLTLKEVYEHNPAFGDYLISFDEFLAQQIARDVMWRQDVTPRFRKFFQELMDTLKEFFSFAEGKRYAPAPVISAWLQNLAMESNLRMLRRDAVDDTLFGSTPRETYAPAVFAEAEMLAPLEAKMVPSMPKAARAEAAESVQNLAGDLDKFGKFSKWALTLLQIADRNPHIAALRNYNDIIRDWWTAKSSITSMANDTLNAWTRAGITDRDALAKMLYAVTLDSYKLQRRLSNEELIAKAQEFGVGQEGIEMFLRIDTDFRVFLEQLEQSLIDESVRNLEGQDPAFTDAMVKQITDEFNTLHQRNYFPLARFGEYTLTVRATKDVTIEGQEYKAGQVVWFETFESKRQRKQQHATLSKRFAGDSFSIGQSILPEHTHSYIGFPPSLLDKMQVRLGLTTEQMRSLKEMSVELNPTQSFRKSMLNRKGIMGFDLDAQRVYAQYFMHGSNHLARLKYGDRLAQEVETVREQGLLISKQGGDGTARGQIASWMADHLDYILRPENEWAHVRSFMFLWHLGGNIKSAVVNLTQTPMVTLPHLAAEYGDVKATKELVKAMKDMRLLIGGKFDALTDAERRLFERLVASGVIDESLASELAAVSEGNLITRYITTSRQGRALRMLASWGAIPFQLAEKFNRRLTALASMRLEAQRGGTEEEAYRAALKWVQGTQYEYARWNRPQIMRGKKSILFVFQQYVQNTLYLAVPFFSKNPARVRLWAMLFIFGGMMGLPGAEDLLKALSKLTTAARDMLGIKDPRVNFEEITTAKLGDLAKDMQEAFGIGVGWPEYFMHGISRKSFGLHAVGQAVGLPIPALDFSTSITMGRISGISEVVDIFDGTGQYNTDIVRGAAGMLGPVGSDTINVLKAFTSKHPDPFIRWERAMPAALRSVSRASRFYTEGAALNQQGDRMIEFQPDDMAHRMELLGQFFGATPTRLSRKQQIDWAARQGSEFWQSRRETILQNYFWAKGVYRNKRDTRTVISNIRQYNRQVPFPEMRISRKDVQRSLKSRLRNRALREAGVGTTKRYRRLQREIRGAYGEE